MEILPDQRARTTVNSVLDKQAFRFASGPVDLSGLEIIIPVFNGFEALQRCMDAVLVHTSHQVPVKCFNDASTDSRVSPYLNQLSEQHQHIQVIHHKQNLGYLHNVNTAMLGSEKDVVLLNADTEVTNGWLEAMRQVATEASVGMVCPLSDHATILSLSSELVDGFAHLKKLSGLWFEIPTAVGFCVLIKREVVSRLGGFDAYFDPGYGEECDYSMQALAQGWRVAAAASAFVFHEGSQSFEKRADALKNKHEQLLLLRWPYFNHEVQRFNLATPLLGVEAFIRAQEATGPRVLHVVHGIDATGGVELFTRGLIERLDGRQNHAILVPDHSVNRKQSQRHLAKGLNVLEIPLSRVKAKLKVFNYRAELNQELLDRFFVQLICLKQFDVVHFHSMVDMGSAIWPQLCHALSVPYVMSIHDHYGLCQIFSLSRFENNQEQYCGKKKMDPDDAQCVRCVEDKTSPGTGEVSTYMRQRQIIWDLNLKHCKSLYFPSFYLKDLYAQEKPWLEARSSVVFPFWGMKGPEKLRRPDLQRPTTKVAFIGQFGDLKGPMTFLKAHEILANNDQLEWHVIGGIHPKYKALLTDANVRCLGAYRTETLPDLMADIDLAILPSSVPETHSLVLSEMMALKVPVVASNLGAFKERVSPANNGWLFQYDQPESLAELVLSFHRNKAQFKGRFEPDWTGPEQIIEHINNDYQSLHQPTNLDLAVFGRCPLPELMVPKHAGELVQQWLDAAHTLEASDDWRDLARPLDVCVLGVEQPGHEQQAERCQTVRHEWASLWRDESLTWVLLKAPGVCLNENIGNWVHALQAKDEAMLSTANYLICDGGDQAYGPQFMQKTSKLNRRADARVDACVWVHVGRTKALLQNSSPLSVDEVVQAIGQQEVRRHHHFPHHCYTWHDAFWAPAWKRAMDIKLPAIQKQKHRLIVLLNSARTAAKLKPFIKSLRGQKGVHLQEIFWQHPTGYRKLVGGLFEAVSAARVNQDIQSANDAKQLDGVLLINDNVWFQGADGLSLMASDMAEHGVDVMTIPAGLAQNDQYLHASKLGGAMNHWSKGQIRNRALLVRNHPVEHIWLDEDCALFKPQAWLTTASVRKEHAYYEAYWHSLALLDQGHTIATLNRNLVLKRGVPSGCGSVPAETLEQAREALRETTTKAVQQDLSPPAFSHRARYGLDLYFGTFKTPKTLPRIAAYAHDSWGSGYYRAKLPVTTMAAVNKASVIFLPEQQRHGWPTPVELEKMSIDVLYVHHGFSDFQLLTMRHYREQLGCRIVLSIDDLFLDLPDYNPVKQQLPNDMKSRIQEAMKLADRVVVGSKELARAYQDWHPEIRVIPNRLSGAMHQQLPAPPANRTEKLRVGWAGAGQHEADLNWVKGVVEATKNQVHWVFFGCLPDGISANDVEYHAPVPFHQYMEKLSQLRLDVGVAPLVDNPFNRCKTHLKLLEYGALSMAVLCSDLPCYQGTSAVCMPNDGEQWIRQIREWSGSPAILREAQRKMQAWVQENGFIDDNHADWASLLLSGWQL